MPLPQYVASFSNKTFVSGSVSGLILAYISGLKEVLDASWRGRKVASAA
jgi:hypothetical protein